MSAHRPAFAPQTLAQPAITVLVHDFPLLSASRRQLRQGDCTDRAFLLTGPGRHAGLLYVAQTGHV